MRGSSVVYLCRDRRESVCLGKWCYRSSWDEPPLGGSRSSLAVYITAKKELLVESQKKQIAPPRFYPFCLNSGRATTA